MSSQATSLTHDSSVLSTILRAGLACGVMDITAALLVYCPLYHLTPVRLLQGIASGVLGPEAAVKGGLAAALLGLLCHFTIAMGAATVFVLSARKIGFLVNHAVISGALYGIAVYFFMQNVVLPLSAARSRSFNIRAMVIGVVIHIFCVGMSIALTTQHYLPLSSREAVAAD